MRQKAYERIKADGGEQIRKAQEASAKANRFIGPWNNPNADKETWLLAYEVFQMFCDGELQFRAAKKLDMSGHKLIAMYKRFKEGWNPGLCPEWQQFKSEYSPTN